MKPTTKEIVRLGECALKDGNYEALRASLMMALDRLEELEEAFEKNSIRGEKDFSENF